MLKAKTRDAVAGWLVAGFGLATAIYSYMHYPMGTVSRMGTGMFPVALGVGLAAVGLGIVATARFGEGPPVTFHLRGLVFVLIGLALFGLILPWAGLVPALLVLVAVAARAARQLDFLKIAILAVVVSAGVSFIFNVALQLRLELLRWPL